MFSVKLRTIKKGGRSGCKSLRKLNIGDKMTYQNNFILCPENLKKIIEQGLDYIQELIRVPVTEALKE